jgi:FMN-dependent oxidoreductase (nitrilotriacetate monooxygenase family)
MAGVTDRVGLIVTASTSYSHPYNLARMLASMDHITSGRAGWNIVTSAGQQTARNFGMDDAAEHSQRYARASEFVDVVTRLWDSWDDDALVLDQASGEYADPSRIRSIGHSGEFFRIDGPLNVPRPPQGHPVLVQAGSSAVGMALAAECADAVFTAHQTLDSAQRFYADLKGMVEASGRSAEHVNILPGIVPFIASTETEARQLEDELGHLIVMDHALFQLSNYIGMDVSGFPLDEPLDIRAHEDDINYSKSRFALIRDMTATEELTLRQVLHRLGSGRGHHVFSGTPEQLAQHLILWFEERGADGFNIMPPLLEPGLVTFVDEVVPILQKRGFFRRDYGGATLREHYGVARPENRFAPNA